MTTADEAERKMHEGFERLNEGDAEGALALGRELEELRHTSGFEIQALAHEALGDANAAVEVLERGVTKGPTVWLLWQLLGNNYSDEGRYDDAAQAYERALGCPGAETLSVHYNIATLLTRQERLEEALSHLDLGHVTTEDASRKLLLLVASQRINLLNQLGRHDDALKEGRTLITRDRAEGTEDELLAPVLGEYASVLLSAAGDREGAERAAWDAIRLDKFDQTAMWVLRELNGPASADGSLYRLLLVGRWHQPFEDEPELPGFFTTYEVVADSPDEALELARRFEPPDVRETLRIEESEVVEARPDEARGVYSASGYSFFPGHEFEEAGAS